MNTCYTYRHGQERRRHRISRRDRLRQPRSQSRHGAASGVRQSVLHMGAPGAFPQSLRRAYCVLLFLDSVSTPRYVFVVRYRGPRTAPSTLCWKETVPPLKRWVFELRRDVSAAVLKVQSDTRDVLQLVDRGQESAGKGVRERGEGPSIPLSGGWGAPSHCPVGYRSPLPAL